MANNADRSALRALSLLMTAAAALALVALPAGASGIDLSAHQPTTNGTVGGTLGEGLPGGPVGLTCGILNALCKWVYDPEWCDYWI